MTNIRYLNLLCYQIASKQQANLKNVYDEVNKMIECSNLNNKILMTDQQIIEVISAHMDGKTIEYKRKGLDNIGWHVCCPNPMWDFRNFDYRVKEEPKYRPYKSAEEFLKAQKEHGPYLEFSGDFHMPLDINNEGVKVFLVYYKYETVLKDYTWQDGHPTGILE